MKHLTPTAIAAAVRRASTDGKQIHLTDPEQTGLQLRCSPGGTRTWVWYGRDATGRPRRFKLGDYPDMGLAHAREAARALRPTVRAGADPIAEARKLRQTAEDARAGVGTLQAVLDVYGRQRGNAQRAWTAARQRIDLLFKPLLAKPAASLTAIDFQLIADGWDSQWSAAYAVRSLRPALKWAVKRGYLPPGAADISPPVAVRRRERVLSPEELQALTPVLKDGGPHAQAMWFMLLTLARRSEVAEATWGEIDLHAATWTLPGSRTKNGKAHTIPLSRQAIAMLRTRLPASPDPAMLVFPSDEGTALGNWDRQTKRLQAMSGTTGWTRHDLRRTGATMLGNMLVPPHVIEAALNHAHLHSQIASVYNAARYLPAVAEALQQMADHLDVIGTDGGNVIPLVRRN
jgi:integrase